MVEVGKKYVVGKAFDCGGLHLSVGDIVEVLDNDGMEELNYRIKIISSAGQHNSKFDFGYCDDRAQLKEPKQKVVIYVEGNCVYAKDMFSGLVGRAKCSPNDRPDFLVGAQIALQRLARSQGSKVVFPNPTNVLFY